MTTCYKHYRPGLKRKPCVGYVSLTAAGTHLYLWVERDNVEQSWLSEETEEKICLPSLFILKNTSQHAFSPNIHGIKRSSFFSPSKKAFKLVEGCKSAVWTDKSQPVIRPSPFLFSNPFSLNVSLVFFSFPFSSSPFRPKKTAWSRVSKIDDI